MAVVLRPALEWPTLAVAAAIYAGYGLLTLNYSRNQCSTGIGGLPPPAPMRRANSLRLMPDCSMTSTRRVRKISTVSRRCIFRPWLATGDL